MLIGTCHCGAVTWTLGPPPDSATACNCTICRRYGALWAYGNDGEDVTIQGSTAEYRRGTAVGYAFCSHCGCLTHYRALKLDEEGRRKMAVNLRMSEPDAVATLPVQHFDGLHTFDDLPDDGTLVRDVWF